jgi:hypothetical protein
MYRYRTMKLQQISLLVENQAGALAAPCRILAKAGINIHTLAVADTEKFGIMRLIVKDWETAGKELKKGGFTVSFSDVVAVSVPDRPGGLAEILSVAEENAINVEYLYAYATGKERNAILIFRFENPDLAIRILAEHGIDTINAFQLFEE